MKKITLKEKQEDRKEILNSYGKGDKVSEEHEEYLKDLLSYHENRPEKVGSGQDSNLRNLILSLNPVNMA